MKATKKLILAAISLVAASSLTVGSTFAWFSYQSSVDLDFVDFTVDSGSESLQVAVTNFGGTYSDSDFKYSLTTDDVKTAIKKNNSDTEIVYQPLTVAEDSGSTVLGTNPINLIYELKNEEDTAVNASVSSYATFDLIFRYTPAESANSNYKHNLLLDFGSTIKANPEDDATYSPLVSCEPSSKLMEKLRNGDYGKTLSADDEIKARARDAARVAFLFDNNGTVNNKVWAPSESYTIDSSDTSDEERGFFQGNLASDYKSEKTGAQPVSAPTYASRVYAAPNPKFGSTNTNFSQIAEFPAVGEKSYSELKITVKVWLEGKDGDCLESIQGDVFAFLLKFRASSSIVSGS